MVMKLTRPRPDGQAIESRTGPQVRPKPAPIHETSALRRPRRAKSFDGSAETHATGAPATDGRLALEPRTPAISNVPTTLSGRPALPDRSSPGTSRKPRGVSDDVWDSIFPPDRGIVARIAGRLFSAGGLTPDEAILRANIENMKYEWRRLDEGGHLHALARLCGFKFQPSGLPTQELADAWHALGRFARGEIKELPYVLPEDKAEQIVKTMLYCHPPLAPNRPTEGFFLADDPMEEDEEEQLSLSP